MFIDKLIYKEDLKGPNFKHPARKKVAKGSFTVPANKIDEGLKALKRIQAGKDQVINYNTVVNHFTSIHGIKAKEIDPKENVFTYKAWLGKNRIVQKGQQGCKIMVKVTTDKNGQALDEPYYRKVYVFHISQTKEL